MKNISAANLNKALMRIRETGFDPFTDLKFVQQENPRIVRAHGRAQSGKIMSYNESVAFQKSMQSKNPNIRIWTKQEYQDALSKFYEEHKTEFTVRGAKEKFYEKAIDVLERAGSSLDADLIKQIPIEELRSMFEAAADYAKSIKDSWAFYEFLTQEIDDYYNNNMFGEE